ncbi:response regulator [Nitrospira sp. NS4]|uniref:response regulator n=1 Tax=Nitrospira sp. NS4 TaxID=3414498 RepID=UPI003C30C8DE
MATVLLIDDEAQVRTFSRSALEGAGYQVLSADSGKAGLRLLQDHAVDVILVDLYMPEMDGLELIPLIWKTHPARKIIAMSGYGGEWNYLDVAKHLGVNVTLTKPFSVQELLGAVFTQLKP